MTSFDSAIDHIDDALGKLEGRDPKTYSTQRMALPDVVDCALADACETAIEIEEEAGVTLDRTRAVEDSKRFVRRVRASGQCRRPA